MKELDLKNVEVFLRRHGSSGARVLSALGKQSHLIRALETEVGKALLEDSVNRMDVLLLKIINEESNEKDRAEYRVLKDLTSRWASKITAYFTNLNKVGGK